MSTPIILKLDAQKMNRNWFFQGQKGNYIDLVCYENDQIDQYGNSHVVKQNPPRELRDQGEKPIIVGNGKWMPGKGGQQQQRPAPPARREPMPPVNPKGSSNFMDEDDTSPPF